MIPGNPFASGAFRLVSRGEYTDGPQAGRLFVAKWFKQGRTKEAAFFATDVLVAQKSEELVRQFTTRGFAGGCGVRLLVPQVWSLLPRERVRRGRYWKKGPQFLRQGSVGECKKVLVEPFLDDFVKLNSNTGLAFAHHPRWARDVAAALSHFSYHATGGQQVLCDLQGAMDGHKSLVLSDPVILSREKGRYGPTDLGPEGISTFFSQHVCGGLCGGSWTKPKDVTQYLPVVSGTSMTHGAPEGRRYSGGLSVIGEDEEDDEW